MVGAAFGVDVAVLCVAADEGPMPQTAEHLDVLRLLGVQAGVVALTKSDLLPGLGPDHRELLLLELKDLVAGSFLEEAAIVECSARTGQGLPELVRAIAQAVRSPSSAPGRRRAASASAECRCMGKPCRAPRRDSAPPRIWPPWRSRTRLAVRHSSPLERWKPPVRLTSSTSSWSCCPGPPVR